MEGLTVDLLVLKTWFPNAILVLTPKEMEILQKECGGLLQPAADGSLGFDGLGLKFRRGE